MILPLRLPRRAIELHCARCNTPVAEGEGLAAFRVDDVGRESDVLVHRDSAVCKAALA